MFPVHAISLMPLLHWNAPWHPWPLSCQTVAPLAPSFTLQRAHTAHPILSPHIHAHFFLWCLGGQQLPHACTLLQALSRRGATLPGKLSLRQVLPGWGSPSPTLPIYVKIPKSRDRKPPESLRVWNKLFGLFSPHLKFSISLFLFPYKSP